MASDVKMGFRVAGFAAVVLLTMASVAAAQSGTDRQAQPPAGDPSVQVGRLPIDLNRIQRKLQDSSNVEGGLNLRYTVDVFGQAPPLVLFGPQDNVRWGLAPYGAPTHQELLNVITPREFQSPMMDFSSLLRWLNDRRRRDESR